MTPRKGQDKYHARKHGERAEAKGKELSKPLENGNPVPDPMCSRYGSAKFRRKHAHHVNRQFIRRWLWDNITDFLLEASEIIAHNNHKAAVARISKSEAELREERHASWMYKKAAASGFVTVTGGKIWFDGKPPEKRSKNHKVREEIFALQPA